MALKINADATQWRCAAGEAICFSYQPSDLDGNPDDLTGRRFFFSIFRRVNRASVFQREGEVDAVNGLVVWRLDGTLSTGLYGNNDLSIAITEAIDNGQEQHVIGLLTVDTSAPDLPDVDNAPISRYMLRIQRLADLSSQLQYSEFRVSMEPYSGSTDPDPDLPPAALSLSFSDPDNSGFIPLL